MPLSAFASAVDKNIRKEARKLLKEIDDRKPEQHPPTRTKKERPILRPKKERPILRPKKEPQPDAAPSSDPMDATTNPFLKRGADEKWEDAAGAAGDDDDDELIDVDGAGFWD